MKLPKSSRNAKKNFFLEKFSRTFKSTANRRTFNRRTVEVQAHCLPDDGSHLDQIPNNYV